MKKYVVFLVFVGAVLALFCSCNNDEYSRNKAYAQVSLSNIRKGEVLAQRYCGSCHLLPAPSLASAQMWEEGILPNMGPRLGIFEFSFVSYPSGRNDPDLDSAVYPKHPVLSGKEWQYILDYYTATSPDTLPYQKREQNLQAGIPGFDVQTPAVSTSSPALTLVRIDTSITKASLLTFDLSSQSVFRYDKSLAKVDSLKTKGAFVDAVVQDGRWLMCNIGNINPNNARLGSMQYLQKDANGRFQPFKEPLAQQLARPVDISPADLNRDGRTDYLVCEFGFVTGSLSWLEGMADSTFQRHVINTLPGATKAYVKDENADGLPDLWVLFAQGDENISLFVNKGNGRFQQQKMLRFPPSYGSTFFELADMNGDGLQDIIYTCGDNADYSQTLKPYHGIYIFLNKGQNRFEQKTFFPINGCFKALARDYDKDGDLDIAAISFFADYIRQPEESFVYLANKGNLTFQPFSIPESRQGRWLTMDAGDLDGDGWTDLVLGNFSVAPSFLPPPVDWKMGPPFLLLHNKGTGKNLLK